MAAKKRNTGTKVSESPDPAAVAVYRAARNAGGARLTLRQAKAEMVRRAEQHQVLKVAAEAEKSKRQKDEWQRMMKSDVEESLRSLAIVRDFLDQIHKGKSPGGCAEDGAMFARTALAETGSRLEKALFSLGLTEGFASAMRGQREGWFAENLGRLPRNGRSGQEQAQK